jgi:hypothetical protein
MPLAFVQGEEMRDDHYVPLSDKGRVITIADWAKCAACIAVLIPFSVGWLACGLVRIAWLKACEVLQ